MLYVASMPGFLLALGMQFAVESPRWLCKVQVASFHHEEALNLHVEIMSHDACLGWTTG